VTVSTPEIAPVMVDTAPITALPAAPATTARTGTLTLDTPAAST
jgi:hypothetical protein